MAVTEIVRDQILLKPNPERVLVTVTQERCELVEHSDRIVLQVVEDTVERAPQVQRVVLKTEPAAVRLVHAEVGPQGPPGPPGPSSGDKFFSFAQGTPAAVWTIAHGLGKQPSVTVVDSAGDEVEGDVSYPDANHVVLTFAAPFSGVAYMN